MHTIKNKTVIITGCSSGIGKTTAKLLKENGWRVFASARNQKDVDKLLLEGFESCQLDLENSSSIQCAFDFVLSKTEGKLYALINSAGFEVISAIEDLTRDELRKQFEVNVFGLQELTNLAIQVFRKQGFGRIINIGSLVGRISLPFTGAYCASKFALEALSDALNIELDKTNIYTSLIEIGSVPQTSFDKNALTKLCNKKTEMSLHREVYKNMEANIRLCLNNRIKNNIPKLADDSFIIAMAIKSSLESKKPRERYFIKPKWHLAWAITNILPKSILNILIKQYRKDILSKKQP